MRVKMCACGLGVCTGWEGGRGCLPLVALYTLPALALTDFLRKFMESSFLVWCVTVGSSALSITSV